MKSPSARLCALSLSLLLAVCVFAGCGGDESALPPGAAANDIISFNSNAERKPLVRIGMQYYTPDDNFENALEQAFPDYYFVLDYGAAAGTTAYDRVGHLLERGEYFDMIVSSRSYFLESDADVYCDLSAQSFLNNYLLASLNQISGDGKIYFVPGVTAMAGIAYNTEMFERYGWRIPADTEEFFALCKEIEAEGIHPFSNCCKYSNQIHALFGTMCYDMLYTSDEDIIWLRDLLQNKATYAGHMEPFYELAKRFADEGLSTIDDFSASLTQQRRAFWAGEHAMMYADTVIYSYASAEGAPFEIGFMPFPAQNAESSGFCVTPSYYLGIPKLVERDPARFKLMMDILSFLSTPEGQQAMLKGSYNISNVKGVDISSNPAFKYMREAYERGNLYPYIDYPPTGVSILELEQASVKTLFEGADVESAIAMMDDSLRRAFEEGAAEPIYETVAVAETDFTVLETSYYMADKLREAARADIGLMLNNSYFRANLAGIEAGEITSDMRDYAMKGVGADDCLTTYLLSGAQLRELFERPIVNGAEVDAMIAASGLAVEYAPWNERGSRTLKLTLEDGSELEDGKLYSVAAWTGVVDESYITETVETHAELGDFTDILLAAFERDGTIAPDIARRVTLVWE